ncbi:glycosyltransferase [Mesorhizobium mediterraneum]|uniref:glycosyltransferase n=1 Tax=Mesorhizobium mediterraneum TaxID=43617 RepID=UPI0017846E35|nr:glycosyltransferase [Mesorhizobium mediterraneum]
MTARSLRIVHTIASIDEEASGPSYSVPALATKQAIQNEEVSVYSVGKAGTYLRDRFTHCRFKSDFKGYPVLGRMAVSGSMLRSLRQAKPDIIHNHGLWLMPNVYGAWVKNDTKAKLVFAPRGMLSPVALRFSAARKKAFGSLFQNRALSSVDLFHATSEQEYEDIRAFGLEAPVAIIPNGIDVLQNGPAAQPKKKIVVSLGRIHPKKGLDRLVRAWSLLEADFPGWRLLILGPSEGGHADELKRLAANLSLTRVQVREAVYGDQKRELLARAELFVLPTLSENFGMTVAESLAAATPVISSKGAPWQMLETKRCGWWIEHGSESLASCLRVAMSISPDERIAMGLRGREWMLQDFSWDSIATRMTESYRWLMDGRRTGPEWIRVLE